MRRSLCVTLVIFLSAGAGPLAGQPSSLRFGEPRRAANADGLTIRVRPGMLAAQIGELAGHAVIVPYARVVGVLNPRAFLIDTSTRLPPVVGLRARVLVLVERGALTVPASTLVANTVTIGGVARTLLGMQVSREVAWPAELTPEAVERLEVRAAILATSVTTPEGVELTQP